MSEKFKQLLWFSIVGGFAMLPIPAVADFINPRLGSQGDGSFFIAALISPIILLGLAGIWAVFKHRKK